MHHVTIHVYHLQMAVFPQTYSRIHDACENPGERLVMEQLRRCLPDECVVWHDIPVGPLQRQPDFVIFHPERGLLVLEVGMSWPQLEDAYPDAGFDWVEFERGGEGVCIISADELLAWREAGVV